MNIFIEKSRLTQFAPMIKFNDHNIFTSYDVKIVDGKIVSNIDLFIVGCHETYNALQEFGPEFMKRVVFSRQARKSTNLALINSIIQNSPNMMVNFRPLDIVSPGKDDPSQYTYKASKYFVKLEFGARSLNTFIVDNTVTPVAYVLGKLTRICGKDKEIYKATLEELAKLDGVKYIKGNVRHPEEHLEYRDMNYFAHEAVENVKQEFRVIQSGHGDYIKVFARKRNESNDGVLDDESNFTELYPLDAYRLRDLAYIIEKLGEFFHGSIDLILDKEDKYSIVETSNQYGACDIPGNIKNTLLEVTIEQAIAIVKDRIDE